MTTYRCDDCKQEFDQNEAGECSGLSDHRSNGAFLERCTWYICPYCGSEDLEELP